MSKVEIPVAERLAWEKWHTISDAQWERNGRMKSNHRDDRCMSCNRPMGDGPSAMIHWHNDGSLFAVNNYIYDLEAREQLDGDQGWFPVGPECAKKIPSAYVSPAAG